MLIAFSSAVDERRNEKCEKYQWRATFHSALPQENQEKNRSKLQEDNSKRITRGNLSTMKSQASIKSCKQKVSLGAQRGVSFYFGGWKIVENFSQLFGGNLLWLIESDSSVTRGLGI